MNKREKLRLIRDLVNSGFEREKFTAFLENILEAVIFQDSGELVGEIREDDEPIGIYIIECSELKDFYNNRRIQRNYIGSLLKKNEDYRRALVAFYSENEEIWRFSLVEKDEGEGVVVPIHMTSHIMGNRGKNTTASKMIGSILEKPKKKSLKGIARIFDMERLTEDFFTDYSEKFFKLREYLMENRDLQEIASNYGEDIGKVGDILAKRVMIRLVLIYFIQKKGWMGAPEDKPLESGDKNFMENFFNSSSSGNINFYRDCMNKLVHEGISRGKIPERYMEELGIKVPFFDHYIFQPFMGVDWHEKSVMVENAFFQGNGEGLIEIFHRYHFSLMENEPYIQDIAVDPEIIGVIFENLLDTGYRKSKGTYYTPRTIVHHMCKETLANYISVNCQGISHGKILDFIRYGEFFWEEDKARIRQGLAPELYSEIIDKLEEIEELTVKIKVVEPSVGSGAFLLGMMGELLKLRKVIERYRRELRLYDKDEVPDDFLLKRDIIRNNLFGVDIDYMAVETTKLRMWLSLIVDAKYYEEATLSKPEGRVIRENSITTDWERDLFERFNIGDGFDIVIGNPPYVGEKGNKDIFREVAKSKLGERYYMGKGDLFYFFFHLGIDILKDRGTLAYITTNYYLTADGALKLREDMRERCSVLRLVDFNEVNVFSKARGQHNIITVLEKGRTAKKEIKTSLCNIKGNLTSKEMSLYLRGVFHGGSYFKMKQEELYKGEKSYIRLERDRVNDITEKIAGMGEKLGDHIQVNQGLVSGADRLTQRHMEKYHVEGEKGDGIFTLSPMEIEGMDLAQYEKELLKGFYKNSHIDRYIAAKESERYIIYVNKNTILEEYPVIEKHLVKYKSILESKREARLGRLPWYSLHWARDREIFDSEKIVAPQRSKNNIFAYNTGEWYASADVYYLTKKREGKLELKYVLALLNSKLYYLWLYYRGKRKGELLELYATPLEEVSMAAPEKKVQLSFIKLVDKIIDIKEKNIDAVTLEREIDRMVYDLYELTEDERKLVEDFYREKQESGKED